MTIVWGPSLSSCTCDMHTILTEPCPCAGRAQILKDREGARSGEAWFKSHQKWTAVDHSKIRIFGSFESNKVE